MIYRFYCHPIRGYYSDEVVKDILLEAGCHEGMTREEILARLISTPAGREALASRMAQPVRSAA
jgi:hypothetical protein